VELNRGKSHGRGRVEIVGWEPAVERVAVMTRTTVSVLATTFGAALTLSLAGQAHRPLGWMVLGAAAVVGLHPLPWYALRSRRSGRLPVWDLDPSSAHLIGQAAEQAGQLHRLADRAPEGPVAEHLDHLAATAQGYVVALHQAATQANVARAVHRDVELEATMTRIVAQLADLTAAAGRLREAQKQHLQTSPLEELTEATERLAAAIETRSTETTSPASSPLGQ
jgi:hypothetical protein